MTTAITDFFLSVYAAVGAAGFGVVSGVITLALCLVIIPRTTDLMVDSAAGLAGKYLGQQQRTMVINASTNLPEFFSMLVAFFMLRVGGIANPLGSNLANIYLMFLVAPLWVVLVWMVGGRRERVAALFALVRGDKRIVCWHVCAGLLLFTVATVALWCITGVDQLRVLGGDRAGAPQPLWMLAGGLLCLAAVAVFLRLERRLRQARADLFENISRDGQRASWPGFFVGTAGLVVACTVMNALFVTWEKVYSDFLRGLLGASVFTGLQYFLGALVTSLPEMTVATRNLRRTTAPDLNTALGSVSYSNMSNLAIAGIGGIGAWLMALAGFRLMP
jgi:hypothetical protein